jgi:glycosyltransferase involved in cell wall biosynthesis
VTLRIGLASIHPRALSGQIDYLIGLARALETLGHHVRLVSPFPEDDLRHGDLLQLAVGDRGALLPKLARQRRILAALRAHAPTSDLLHLNLPTPSFSILADLLQARVSIPVVVGFEAQLAPSAGRLRRRHILAAPSFYLPRLLINNRLVARLTRHRAARYIVGTQFQRFELTALGVRRERIAVIPGIIDTTRLHHTGAPPDAAAKVSARRALDLPEGPLAVYIGHYNHVKGVDLLPPAFAQVAAALPDAHLVLAWSGLGDPGPVEAALARARLGERLLRLGKVDVGKVLAAADLLVLPYRLTIGQAAFPGLILEAMAVGVPLVTTDLPLLREVVDDGQTALLSRPEDPADLARAMLRLLRDPALANRMVAAQTRAFAEHFDPPLLAARYEALYQSVLATTSRGKADHPIPSPSGRGLR